MKSRYAMHFKRLESRFKCHCDDCRLDTSTKWGDAFMNAVKLIFCVKNFIFTFLVRFSADSDD